MIEISIIMPVKNAENWINETIDSIENQSFQNWELIAIDDHSNDNSYQTLITRSESNTQIKVFKNLESGIIPALQLGLSKAEGKFITRMDADDLIPEKRLGLMINEIENSSPRTIITGLVSYFGNQKISPGYLKYQHWINEINLQNRQWINIYRECVIASPNWLISTKELKSIGGFDDLSYPEDYHLVFKWYKNKFHIKTIPQVTLRWREHPDRTSRNSSHYDQKHFFELKINQFLNGDWNKNKVILWGKNPKARLTAAIFDQQMVDYEWMEPKDVQNISFLPHCQILVAVFPPDHERKRLEIFLQKEGRIEGKDWWYL